MPYAAQNTPGVLSPGGQLRYMAVGDGSGPTTVEAVATRGGAVHSWDRLLGAYGIPYVTSPLAGAGLSADGRTLVLGDVSTTFPRTHSSFVVYDAPRLRFRDTFALRGDFAFDALSPDGSRLYLIQHVSQNDSSRYVVRAYDLRAHRLLPGRVADRTQKSWVMQGYPIDRTTSADGRYVYTLYENPGGYPFVHALDTVRGVAHCIGLPWTGSASAVYNMRLTLHGRSLAVHFLSGRRWLRMDTVSWRLAPDRRGGFPWWAWTALGLAAATLLAAYGRRKRAFASGTARRDRGSARLGPWLPLTRTR
jgi:hypothetical protein